MDRKVFTVAIIGCGSRGAEAYGRIMAEEKEKFSVVSLCDTDGEKLKKYGELFGVSEADRFLSEKAFFSRRRADALVIATMDNDHVRQCERALELGYDILLENPLRGARRNVGSCSRRIKSTAGKWSYATFCGTRPPM